MNVKKTWLTKHGKAESSQRNIYLCESIISDYIGSQIRRVSLNNLLH